ncbi:serine/threonine protein kinase [Streptomyces asoensis]|uniref:non-specific serine/threonine protein kinase n=1 Tax=Streptomyces asoensis TaxID=249586 RepID=A0A6M4WUH2_9ACTN|nr:serine/threonine-protein kinase [Streptomyces asoensis]QJT03572.1 serine/threonine protein kinase [Streptomyces asoensis]
MSNDGGPGGAESRTVGGRYRLLERIGSGGMGTVWRARDELMEREVAVKQPRLPGDPEDDFHRRAAHRLHREARAAARVDHPSAVAIHDVVVEEGTGADAEGGLPWIVMELVRGESLHEVLKRGPLEPAEAARIGLAVLGALRAAHAVGIVHRDVKPANVLVGPHGRVVLTDFGIAHIQGEESLTVSGEFVGSLEFVAPERMSGRGGGPASDLWSLGVLLYAAVEGWSPFRRTTVESTLAAIIAADPPEPKQAGPLGPLVVRLLVRDPVQRPDPAEVAEILAAVTEGRPVPAPAGERGEDTEAVERGERGEHGEYRTGEAEKAERAEEAAKAPEEEKTEDEEKAEEAEPQDVRALQEFGEDAGTVRVGAARRDPAQPSAPPTATDRPGPQPDPASASASAPASAPAPATEPGSVGAGRVRRSLRRRSPVLAVLGGLLVGGTWWGSAWLGGADSGAGERPVTYAGSASTEPSASAVTGARWVAHREAGLDAVLSLPSRYRQSARQGGADQQPRLVVYSAGSVDVRLTLWDQAPAAPMARAAQAHETWNGYALDARTQTTRSSFHGDEAALADTTYGLDATPTRVMELFVLTADARMYELRVDMPKGTPEEKQGTAVFKEARDRLEIGK